MTTYHMIIHSFTARSNDIEHRKIIPWMTNSCVSKARQQQGNYITLIGGKEGTEGIGTSSIIIWPSSSSYDTRLCHNNNILILTTATRLQSKKLKGSGSSKQLRRQRLKSAARAATSPKTSLPRRPEQWVSKLVSTSPPARIESVNLIQIWPIHR